jgi:hypothetical protein
MELKELCNHSINKSIAYFVGLAFPLTKTIDLKGKKYVVGSINHNPNMIEQKDLASHFNAVYKLVTNELGENEILIQSNKSDLGTISKKEGFGLLVECDGYSGKEIDNYLYELTEKIYDSNDDIRIEFVKGCFDGRGSWDTTAHYFSIDVDRDYRKQDLIEKIISSLEIGININRREKEHPKNDQIRIKKDSIEKFLEIIQLYSLCRKKLITNGLSKIKKES